ncbi:MAG: N-acetyl-gamma-glutamyl-phosphate reductase [Syntrophus sp. (in: bacteria)]|nr:N-acetyl-gamma-glutamyl-phosphate reductase [Syntrophus sp. (in: bacteria)]
MIRVGVYGASGYTGQELVKHLLFHPEAAVTAITSRRYAGVPLADVYPAFQGLTELTFMNASPDEVAGRVDVVFLALPHGVSMTVAPAFLAAGKKVIDLSADFRLRDAGSYERWYEKHTAPALLAQAAYGIPELYRDTIREADLVANPGCYPTSVILGLAPVLKAGWIDTASIIVDAKSGVSGAGREPQVTSLFCEVNEGFKAYKVGGQHRHIPEMEQELARIAGCEIRISFTPHLLPVNRGILSTIYGSLQRDVTPSELTDLYRQFYQAERFIRICKPGVFPNISSVCGSNGCDIGLAVDKRTRRIIVLSAIDNLIKGAAGQAIQNMNLICGYNEETGLKGISRFP